MDDVEVEFIARDGGETVLRQVLPGRDALVLIARGIARPAPPKTQAARAAVAVPPTQRPIASRTAPKSADALPEGVMRFMSRIERHPDT